MAKVRGLGRGLDALLGGDDEAVLAPRAADRPGEASVDVLRPGKYQPRTHMDDGALKDLADSIRAQGVIQPILVRPVEGGGYEIIAGERRWRAARMAGLETVPIVVREVADNAALAMALIENIQREDLNPLEQATGIQRLIDEFGITHDRAAEMVGRSRSAVTNVLRLLALAAPVRELVQQGKLDMGHARALLALSGMAQIDAARMVVARGLSVRDTERLVSRQLKGAGARRTRRVTDRDILRLQEDLSQKLGTRVTIKAGRKDHGSLVIDYTSLAQLDAILDKLIERR